MALPSSGPIKFSDINTELNFDNNFSLNLGRTQVRTLFGVASGAISMSQGYGKANSINAVFFAGGSTVSQAGGNQSVTLTTEKYNLDTDARTAGTNLATLKTYAYANTGNYTAGYIFGGLTNATNYASQQTATVAKYTYQTDAIGSGTNLSVPRFFSNGLGNSTTGYIVSGVNWPNYILSIEKYTYASETRTMSATSLSEYRQTGATGMGLSNSTRGILYGGGGYYYYLYTTEKFTFATEALSSGTYSDGATTAGTFGASSNSTTGYMFGGYIGGALSPRTRMYTFSSDTVTSGTNLTFSSNPSAAGNATKAIVGGGINSGSTAGIATVNRYIYSTNSVLAITSLATARYAQAQLSGNPSF